jgi:hypothetical protein
VKGERKEMDFGDRAVRWTIEQSKSEMKTQDRRCGLDRALCCSTDRQDKEGLGAAGIWRFEG